jgi:predicted ATPase/class 3 adenylate cyclase
MPELPTGTVTFLFSDIEGSTKLLQRLGDGYVAVLADHQRLLRQAWVDHDGVEIGTEGDSFFVAFPSALAAVGAAAQATQALAAHPWPEGGEVRVRMGLHTGTPLLTAAGYVGLDVHRAARIAAAGHGGQILLSEATRALSEHELPAGTMLRDVGTQRLKDLQRPEHLFQLVLPGLPADFPPLKALDRRAHNLPVQPTALVDREDGVASITGWLRTSEVRLVTLTGPGGTGKTRLGLQVAAELSDTFADGVWFVRLSRLTDSALVLPTIAQTLGLRETGSQPIEDVLREHMRTRHLLLLLDNFEQVVAAAAPVAELLATSPGLKVLVTSRTALHLRGEKEYLVPPLGLPSADEARHLPAPERLSQYAAVALFIERARDAKPDFQVTNAMAPAVAEICARLDGLPLALELAAAHVKLLPPPALLQRLERRLPVLTGGARDLEERQQTMRNTLAWSYSLLAADEQRLFQRLGVFVGGWTLEAAEAVCVTPEQAEPLGLNPLETLGALLDHSLIQQREEDGEARFGMLQVIREFAMEQLETSGEADAMHRAHAGYIVALLEEADSHLCQAEQLEWFGRLELERNNVRAALRWARERGEVALGLRLAAAMWGFWWQRGPFSEARSWLESLLAQEAEPSATLADVRPRALFGAGELALGQGDAAVAQTRFAAALTLAREVGDRRTAAEALGSLGILAAHQHDVQRATVCLEESLAIARELGSSRSAARALNNLGVMAYFEGAWAEAVACFEEALTLSRSQGDRFRTASCLMSLGWVATHQRDLERALALGREALTLFWALGNERRAAEALESLAMSAGAAGRGEQAARLLGATAARREIIGAPQSSALRRDTEHAVEAARAAVGEEAWASAFAAGRALSLEEAVAEALQISPQSAALPHADFTEIANQ